MGAILNKRIGTVNNDSGPLTLGQIIVGNGGSDIKVGPIFPGTATTFLDGTGNFSTPSSLFASGNKVLATPADGSAGFTVPRSLVQSDIPNLMSMFSYLPNVKIVASNKT